MKRQLLPRRDHDRLAGWLRHAVDQEMAARGCRRVVDQDEEDRVSGVDVRCAQEIREREGLRRSRLKTISERKRHNRCRIVRQQLRGAQRHVGELEELYVLDSVGAVR